MTDKKSIACVALLNSVWVWRRLLIKDGHGVDEKLLAFLHALTCH